MKQGCDFHDTKVQIQKVGVAHEETRARWLVLDRLLHGEKEGEKAPYSGTTLFADIVSFSYSVLCVLRSRLRF